MPQRLSSRRLRPVAGLLLGGWLALAGRLPGAETVEAEARAAFRKTLAEGAAFLERGKHSRALARFKQAGRIDPGRAEVFYWIGLTWSDLEDYRAAAANAKKATVLAEDMADAWLLWGQSLLYLREFEDAREKLEKAFRLAPRHPLVTFNLGRCYFLGLDDRRAALKFFKETLRYSPKYVPALYYEGCCYMALDLPPLAAASLKEALRLRPDFAEGWFRLGLAYRMDGRYEEAEKAFRNAVERDGNPVEALLQLGYLYQSDLPDHARAIRILRRFLEHAPSDHAWAERVRRFLKASEDARS